MCVRLWVCTVCDSETNMLVLNSYCILGTGRFLRCENSVASQALLHTFQSMIGVSVD